LRRIGIGRIRDGAQVQQCLPIKVKGGVVKVVGAELNEDEIRLVVNAHVAEQGRLIVALLQFEWVVRRGISPLLIPHRGRGG
jgi:hypothetical protein